MPSPLPTKALLIKPIGAHCSMRCSYCFYTPPEELFHGPPLMTVATRRTLQRAAVDTLGADVHLCWQGGEPTLAGLDFYRQAIDEQKALTDGRGMNNSMQTNGLHVDQAWAAFVAKEQMLMGLSMDGPPLLHDLCRKDRQGKGTGYRVCDAARRLLDAGAQVNALCCLSAYNIEYAYEIYDYLKEIGLTHMQFLPIVEGDDRTPGVLADFSVPPEAYGRMLCKLWDAWLADFTQNGPTTHIRFFESFSLRALGGQALDCEMHPTCGRYAVVERDGSIFPCDFFVEAFWKLGTIDEGLEAALCTPKNRHFAELRGIMQPTACRDCPAAFFCHGGCLKFRRLGGSIQPLSSLCAAYKQFVNHALPYVPFVTSVLQWRDIHKTIPSHEEGQTHA